VNAASRWFPFLAGAAALHAVALFGVGLPVRPPPVALDSAPVELSFASEPAAVAAPATPAPETPPRSAAVPEPAPEPLPEPRREPAPEPAPVPEPEPAPRPEPSEAPREPRPAPALPVTPDTQAPAVLPASAQPPEQTVATRFRGKPARNARGYFGQISAWIDANKAYPVECKKDKEQGAVIVKFTIARDGRLLGAAVKTASGYERLDRAALDTLSRAAPFPPIPDFIDRDTLSISVPIEYSLVTE
jgi:protein TonB